MTEIIAAAALLLVLAVLLACIRPAGRRVFLVLGLVFGCASEFLFGLGGPDSPGLIIPAIGFAAAVAALLGETLACAFRLLKRRQPTTE